MTPLTRPEWAPGRNETIFGRRCSIRRITSRYIEWFDRDDKTTFQTPRDVKPDRRKPVLRNREILQWVATSTGAEIGAKVRLQIAELARQNGLPCSVAESVYLDEQNDRKQTA